MELFASLSRERVLPEAFGSSPGKKTEGRPSDCSFLYHIFLHTRISNCDMILHIGFAFQYSAQIIQNMEISHPSIVIDRVLFSCFV